MLGNPFHSVVLNGKPWGKDNVIFTVCLVVAWIWSCAWWEASLLTLVHDQVILTQESFSAASTLLAFNCLTHALTKVTNFLQGTGVSQSIKETERTKVSSNRWGGWRGLSYHSSIFSEVPLADSPNCCRWRQDAGSWWHEQRIVLTTKILL